MTNTSDNKIFGSKVLQWLAIIASVLAVPAFLLTLPPVQSFFFNKDPRLEVFTRGEVPVYNGNRNVQGLQVRFDGRDLTKPPQKIVAISTRVYNAGGSSITPGMIAPDDPVGLRVASGKIVEISRVQASSKHLRSQVKPSIVQGQGITLNSGLIFDPGDFVDIDFLVIENKSSNLEITSLGKVAGQKSIDSVSNAPPRGVNGYLIQTFSGSFSTQVARLLFYMMIGVGFLFALVLTIEVFETRKIRNSSAVGEEFVKLLNSIAPAADIADKQVIGGIFQYVGSAKFAEVITQISRSSHVASSPRPLSLLTLDGVVEKNHDSVCRFLVRQDKDKKPVNYLITRLGYIESDGLAQDIGQLWEKSSTSMAQANLGNYPGVRGIILTLLTGNKWLC